jgi:hypothetical protein
MALHSLDLPALGVSVLFFSPLEAPLVEAGEGVVDLPASCSALAAFLYDSLR